MKFGDQTLVTIVSGVDSVEPIQLNPKKGHLAGLLPGWTVFIEQNSLNTDSIV